VMIAMVMIAMVMVAVVMVAMVIVAVAPWIVQDSLLSMVHMYCEVGVGPVAEGW